MAVVAGFTCAKPGQEETRFERDVSEWLKDRRAGALEAVRLGLSEVRLFFCPNTGSLMAYGAIGKDNWRFEDGRSFSVWVIQYVGVHRDFRLRDAGDIHARLGKRLLNGMIQEVQARGGCDWIGLFVDPENPIKDWYRDSLGFQELDVEQDGDRVWVRMRRRLE